MKFLYYFLLFFIIALCVDVCSTYGTQQIKHHPEAAAFSVSLFFGGTTQYCGRRLSIEGAFQSVCIMLVG